MTRTVIIERDGAGMVDAIRPGVADWRHGRQGTTAERARARRLRSMGTVELPALSGDPDAPRLAQ